MDCETHQEAEESLNFDTKIEQRRNSIFYIP